MPRRALLAILALAACQEVSARRSIQDGNKAYYKGDYELAISRYEAGLASAPQLDIGWYNLGLAHLALFQPGLKNADSAKHAQGAIDALNKYLDKNPNDTQARDYLLSTYIDSGQYQGALKYFEDRLAKDPGDVDAIAQLAQINAQAGQFDAAVTWHKRRAEAEKSTDAKADSWYSIDVLEWRRLNNHAEVVGADRLKIADDGLAALAQADGLRKDHGPTLSYINLLYRERGLASGASWARAADVATAQIYYKRAVEINKAAAAAKPQTPAPKKGQ